jgi:hypothetical protein
LATLAVVEFLGRHGEVVRRELLERLPVELGRAYDNDIVLDDPYVAARHLRIAAAPDGFLLTDLGSRNGMRAIGSKRSANRLEVDAETVVRLGHTQLRVRSASYALPEELPIKPERPYRRALLFLATLLASLAYFGLCDYLDSYQPLDWGLLGSVMAVFLGGLLLWLGVWSSMSRVISGRLSGLRLFLGTAGALQQCRRRGGVCDPGVRPSVAGRAQRRAPFGGRADTAGGSPGR